MSRRSVGLIGCGHISVTHLQAWARTRGCFCLGVFDRDVGQAKKRAAEFGVRVFDDMDGLLEECEVIDVCTPPHTHAELARRVVEADRHLVIEKPLVIELADWQRLQERILKSSATVTVIHNQKYRHSIRKAARWVKRGRIGRVIRFNRQFLTGPRSDRMLGGEAHWSHDLPGGRWFETLPHALYTIYQFVGPLRMASVSVVASESAPRGVRADEVVVVLEGDRCFATIHYSAHSEVNKRLLTVYGTRGVIRIDRLGDVATLSRIQDAKWKRALGVAFLEAGSTLLRMPLDRVSYLLRRLRSETPHAALIRDLDRHLMGKGPPPTPIEEIDYVVRGCDEIGREIDRQIAKA